MNLNIKRFVSGTIRIKNNNERERLVQKILQNNGKYNGDDEKRIYKIIKSKIIII